MKGWLFSLVAASGLLMSAFGYCPPAAQAAANGSDACCQRQTAGRRHCPLKSKKQSAARTCCAQAGIASATEHFKGSQVLPLAHDAPATAAAPQIVAHRLVRSLIRPAGPPCRRSSVLGNRAPPLA